ncbi:hypothetical protein [Natrinema sp. HArc-T2]|uniref:hypothetical protein n=1 Tax=Natrinema sp. HArc-T2 TaxID=3242701 RepID=UPI00359E29B4
MSGQNYDEGGVSFALPATVDDRLAVTITAATSAGRTDACESVAGPTAFRGDDR